MKLEILFFGRCSFLSFFWLAVLLCGWCITEKDLATAFASVLKEMTKDSLQRRNLIIHTSDGAVVHVVKKHSSLILKTWKVAAKIFPTIILEKLSVMHQTWFSDTFSIFLQFGIMLTICAKHLFTAKGIIYGVWAFWLYLLCWF